MKMIRLAVGSANRVKIDAAQNGFEAWQPEAQIQSVGFAVASGVSDQPMSGEETLQGAEGRVQNLIEHLKESAESQLAFDYVVGIEGGIEVIRGKLYASAWIVIESIDESGQPVGPQGLGKSALFPLPPEVQRLVMGGLELGLANDQVFGETNSKHAGGAIGSLTDGHISRQALYEHAMAMALIPLRKKELFTG